MAIKTILKAICDNAFSTEGSGKLNIIGIFENINSVGFPATHPTMSFVLVLSGEPNKEFSYYFNIQDPSGEVIVDKKDEAAKARFGINGRVQLIYNVLNVKIPKEGKYTVNLFIDDFRESLEFSARATRGVN